MKHREIPIYEWFQHAANSRDDEELVRHLFANLAGYTGEVPAEDVIQMVNFLAAVRMMQLQKS